MEIKRESSNQKAKNKKRPSANEQTRENKRMVFQRERKEIQSLQVGSSSNSSKIISGNDHHQLTTKHANQKSSSMIREKSSTGIFTQLIKEANQKSRSSSSMFPKEPNSRTNPQLTQKSIQNPNSSVLPAQPISWINRPQKGKQSITSGMPQNETRPWMNHQAPNPSSCLRLKEPTHGINSPNQLTPHPGSNPSSSVLIREPSLWTCPHQLNQTAANQNPSANMLPKEPTGVWSNPQLIQQANQTPNSNVLLTEPKNPWINPHSLSQLSMGYDYHPAGSFTGTMPTQLPSPSLMTTNQYQQLVMMENYNNLAEQQQRLQSEMLNLLYLESLLAQQNAQAVVPNMSPSHPNAEVVDPNMSSHPNAQVMVPNMSPPCSHGWNNILNNQHATMAQIPSSHVPSPIPLIHLNPNGVMNWSSTGNLTNMAAHHNAPLSIAQFPMSSERMLLPVGSSTNFNNPVITADTATNILNNSDNFGPINNMVGTVNGASDASVSQQRNSELDELLSNLCNEINNMTNHNLTVSAMAPLSRSPTPIPLIHINPNGIMNQNTTYNLTNYMTAYREPPLDFAPPPLDTERAFLPISSGTCFTNAVSTTTTCTNSLNISDNISAPMNNIVSGVNGTLDAGPSQVNLLPPIPEADETVSDLLNEDENENQNKNEEEHENENNENENVEGRMVLADPGNQVDDDWLTDELIKWVLGVNLDENNLGF